MLIKAQEGQQSLTIMIVTNTQLRDGVAHKATKRKG